MKPSYRKYQHGLSLIELMIAITLSLLLLAGVLQVFLSTKQTYNSNNALSRVQESGRFALEFMSFDIRNSGYKGECITAPKILLDTSNAAYNSELYDLSDSIKGWDNANPTWVTGRVSGTDVITLKHAANASGSTASGNTPVNANNVNLNGASSIKQDQIVIIADPQGCDVFQNRSNDNANNLSRGSTGTPGNVSPTIDFSHQYFSDMEILTLQSATYFIKNGTNGLPALFRVTYNTGTPIEEELVSGIQDMQITYGIANSLKQVTSYEVANSGWGPIPWSLISSVRIDILAVSEEVNVVTPNQVIAFNGNNVTIPNGRLAKTFTTTIGIRNRLP